MIIFGNGSDSTSSVWVYWYGQNRYVQWAFTNNFLATNWALAIYFANNKTHVNTDALIFFFKHFHLITFKCSIEKNGSEVSFSYFISAYSLDLHKLFTFLF